jgi:hypothetical protein
MTQLPASLIPLRIVPTDERAFVLVTGGWVLDVGRSGGALRAWWTLGGRVVARAVVGLA